MLPRAVRMGLTTSSFINRADNFCPSKPFAPVTSIFILFFIYFRIFVSVKLLYFLLRYLLDGNHHTYILNWTIGLIFWKCRNLVDHFQPFDYLSKYRVLP